ncbi:MAG: hypothetical protein AABW82_05015 [Nanoarchaeota archaeon]
MKIAYFNPALVEAAQVYLRRQEVEHFRKQAELADRIKTLSGAGFFELDHKSLSFDEVRASRFAGITARNNVEYGVKTTFHNLATPFYYLGHRFLGGNK